MAKRLIEIISGAVIIFCLIANRSDSTHESKLLIWYIIPQAVLKVIVWLGLFFLAGRLLFGKHKDYSKYFYNLLVKLFGDPKKAGKTKH